MNIRYGVEVPAAKYRRMTAPTEAICKFVESNEETMELSFDTKKEARQVQTNSYMYMKNNGLLDRYAIAMRGTKLYVFKKEG